MKILTFDTSLDKTYVALGFDGNILFSETIENHNEKYHSAFLIPTIVKMLKENNITMQDIEAIGTNVGPGSFTGIRACVTVARVFAQQLNVPLVGVSSLEILSKLNKESGKTVVVLDARKGQFFTAVYENGEEVKSPELSMGQALLDLDLSDAFIISDAVSNRFLKENGFDSVIYTDLNEDLGVLLNKTVFEKLAKAKQDDYLWGKLKPLYLQLPPVLMAAKPKV